MISETSQIEREYERAMSEAEQIAAEEADRAWARMQPGGDCYPYSPIASHEAIAEAPAAEWAEVAKALADGDDCYAGRLIRTMAWDYWERQAKAPRVLRSVR